MTHKQAVMAVLLFALLTLAIKSSAMEINGIGRYEFLGKERFIAAIYLDAVTDNSQKILSGDYAATLEMRVSAQTISRRGFSRRWLEAASINSNADTMAEHIGHFSQFNQFFKGSLKKGDKLILDFMPHRGTRVALNGVILGVISSDNFFQLLLQGWLGDIPLSSEFRQGLLSAGKIDAELNTRFQTLTYSAERRSAVLAWQEDGFTGSIVSASTASAPVITAIAATSTESVKVQAKPTVKVASNSASVAAREKTKVGRTEQSDAEGGVRQSRAKEARKETRKETRKKTRTAAVKTTAVNSSVTSQPVLTQKVSARSSVKAPVALKSPAVPKEQTQTSNSALASEAELLEYQRYFQALSKQIYKYQTLPRQAFQRRQQGEVRVAVTVDRKGYIVESRLEQASKYKSLNRQALDAVESAGPFAPLPASIDGKRYTFNVPLVYRLPY